MKERFSITGEQVTALATGTPVDFDFTVRSPDFAQSGSMEPWLFTLVPPDHTAVPGSRRIRGSASVPLGDDAGLEGKVRAKLSEVLDGIMAGDASACAATETLGRVLVSVVTARVLTETADLGVHVHNYGTEENSDPQG